MYDVLSAMFANGSTTAPWTLGSSKTSKYCFCLHCYFWLIFTSVDWQLNPNFNCSGSFVLSGVEKITTGT